MRAKYAEYLPKEAFEVVAAADDADAAAAEETQPNEAEGGSR
jgi:hypothetical protein